MRSGLPAKAAWLAVVRLSSVFGSFSAAVCERARRVAGEEATAILKLTSEFDSFIFIASFFGLHKAYRQGSRPIPVFSKTRRTRTHKTRCRGLTAQECRYHANCGTFRRSPDHSRPRTRRES